MSWFEGRFYAGVGLDGQLLVRELVLAQTGHERPVRGREHRHLLVEQGRGLAAVLVHGIFRRVHRTLCQLVAALKTVALD